MPWLDKSKKHEADRRRVQGRRDAWFADKKCAWCGSTNNLQLDHIDPKSKVGHRVWYWSEERREAELAKCQPLCETCHIEKSREEQRHLEHGTHSGYSWHGCRCVPCTEAHRLYNATWRA